MTRFDAFPGPRPARRTLRLLCLWALVAFVLEPAEATPIVFDGATVHPIVGESFEGRVVVEDGRIVAVGPDVAIPEGAEVHDVTGRHLYPGFCDASSQLGLLEIGSVSATDDRTESGAANPHLLSATAIHPASEVIPVTRANGITHSIIAPRVDRDGLIGGQAGLFHLDGWTVEEMALEPSVAMIVNWPEIQTRRFDFTTFSWKEAAFAEAEEKAKERRDDLTAWIDAARHWARGREAGSERLAPNPRLEALARVLDGELPILMMVDERRGIESAIDWAEDQGLRILLGGAREAHLVADVLAEKQIPVVLGLTLSLPRAEDDSYDLPFRNAGVLASAGVRIAFASGAGGGWGPGGPHGSRSVPWEAAAAIPFGLEPGDALKALTLWPAEMFGAGDLLGSIEPGKVANLFVSDGDPLELTTRVLHVMIDGELVDTSNRHHRLYEQYRGR